MPGTESTIGLVSFYLGGGVEELFAPVEVSPLDEAQVLREVCEAAIEGDPLNLRALFVLGDYYTRAGEYARGLRIDIRLVTLRPHNPVVRYNLACSYSLIGFTELALFVLDQAVELGFSNAEHMLTDADLENVRSTPRFRELLRKAERKGHALA